MKLSSKLPRGNQDGLQRLGPALVAEPHRPRFAIIAIDCMRVTTDTDSGEEEPTARILRVEAIDHRDYVDAYRLMRRAYDARVPQIPLPFGDKGPQPKNPLDTLFAAARDSDGRTHLRFDEDGNIVAFTLDGTEVTISTAEEAIAATDRPDPLLSAAMDAVIIDQVADVARIAKVITEHVSDTEDPPTDDEIEQRAERILEQLAAAGIVSAPNAYGQRTILFTRDGVRIDSADTDATTSDSEDDTTGTDDDDADGDDA